MKSTLVLASLTVLASFCAEANQAPVAVTGFNQDLVVETGIAPTFAGLQSSITATMDGGIPRTGSTWYAIGENASAPTTGLPMGTTFVSASDPTTSFALQSAVGNNAIMLDSSHISGSLSLTTPAVFSSLSLLTSSAVGPTTVGVTLEFSDLTSLSLGNFVVPDWFSGSPVVYAANGRIFNGGFGAVNSGNPCLYQLNLILSGTALSKPIVAIDFVDVSGGASRASLFGVSGSIVFLTPVPEPESTLGFLLTGLAGLLGLQVWRRSTSRTAIR